MIESMARVLPRPKMKEIKLPFKKIFEERLRAGEKTCTLRIKQYGKSGDTFVVFGYRFELTAVCPTTVRLGIKYLYQQEGFEQPGLLWEVWDEIHPRLARDAVVFAHFFRRVACINEEHAYETGEQVGLNTSRKVMGDLLEAKELLARAKKLKGKIAILGKPFGIDPSGLVDGKGIPFDRIAIPNVIWEAGEE